MTGTQRIVRGAWPALAIGLLALSSELAPAAYAQVRTRGEASLEVDPAELDTTPGAADVGGQVGRRPADRELVYHVLDRLTYGANEEELAKIERMGVDSYIRYQLHGLRIPEGQALLAKLAALPPAYTPVGDPNWRWQSLWAEYPLRARYSRRQLNEVMTDFWFNHFDVALDYGNDAGVAGLYSSLTFDGNGRPVIAHSWNEHPFCSRWDGTRWVTDNCAPVNIPYGWFTSAATDPTNGQPAVAFYEPNWPGRANGDLHLTRFDGSAWNDETVDRTGDVGAWCSLRFDRAGHAGIAYRDLDNGALKVALHDGTRFNLQTIELGNLGYFAAIAFDAADRPAVAYYDLGRQSISYAAFDGTGWSIVPVVSIPAAAIDWSEDPAPPRLLTLGFEPLSGQPAIAFYDPEAKDLKYAVKSGTSFTIATVDAPGDVGLYPSLAFDPSSRLPALAYFDRGNYHLKLARFDGTAWSAETVDASHPITGPWASLAFAAGQRPAIASYNGSSFALQYHSFDGTRFVPQTVVAQGSILRTHTTWMKEYVEGLRQNALGCFRDLLRASAMTPAMMAFLNNDLNIAGRGNENYARELLELHTLGVDGGYNQTDVETVAKALTGWSQSRVAVRCDVERAGFCYNHQAHDGAARSILGGTVQLPDDRGNLPENWMKQGEQILDVLARHPSTARFVCGKLIRKFVADTPPPRLWDACQEAFLSSDGDIQTVLRTLFFSPEFKDPQNFVNKVKTPIEYSIGAIRKLEGDTDGISVYPRIEDQGMAIFFNLIPTGYAETGSYWINGNSFLQRWKLADWLTHASAESTVDPAALLLRDGIGRADDAVEFFLERLVRGHASTAARAALLDCLNSGDPGNIDLADPQVGERLRDTVEMILGLPESQKQ